MGRCLAIAAIVASLPQIAWADEYSSTTEFLSFDGTADLAQYSGWEIVESVNAGPATIGVRIAMNPTGIFDVRMEAESDVSWRSDEPGILEHMITPLPGSGSALLQSAFTLYGDFTLDINIFGQGIQAINFRFLSIETEFALEENAFDPFLLSGQTPSFLQVQPTPTSGGFDRLIPLFAIPIGLGPVTFTVGANLRLIGTPNSQLNIFGDRLLTEVGIDFFETTDYLTPAWIELWEKTDELDARAEYFGTANFFIEYRIDVAVQVPVGVEIFGFGIINTSFEFNIWGIDLPVVPAYNQTVTFNSIDFAHPLPILTTPIPAINFGNVDVGDSIRFQYPLDNDGKLDLIGVVGIDGDPDFEASPPSFLVVPGGQEVALVTFTPSTRGAFEGFLLLESNDPVEPVKRVPITGTGVIPDESGDGWGPDTPGGGGVGTFYSACGCAAGAWSLPGMAPMFLVGLTVLARRRRR